LKYYIACAVDQFIDREDSSFDFFMREGDHVADLLKLFLETIPAHFREKLCMNRSAHNRRHTKKQDFDSDARIRIAKFEGFA
jgi:hypothetical protein